MRLLRNTEVPQGASFVVFRSSSFGAGVAATIFLGVFVAFGFGVRHVLQDVSTWVAFLLAPVALACGALLWLVSASAFGALYASFLSTNWTMKVGKGGVWLQLRSYLNHAFEASDESALFLPFDEIVSARRVVERSTRETTAEESQVTKRTLELSIRPEHTRDIQQAVRREAQRPGPETSFLGISSRSRANHRPVFVFAPGRLRVDWYGRRMLGALEENGVAILADLKVDGDATPADDRILELIEQGQTLQAIALVRKTHRMGLAEAKAFVEDLAHRAA